MRYLLLFILLSIVATGYSQKYRFEQNFKIDELKEFKNAKVYIGLTAHEEVNNALRDAIKDNWSLTEITGEKTIETLQKEASENKNIAYIALVESKSSNLFSDKSGIAAKSKTYALQINKDGNKYGFYHQYLCYAEGFKENIDLSVAIGVKMLNSKLKTIDENNIKKSKRIKKHAKANADVFTTKTLYIPKEWLGDINEEDFKNGYEKKVKFVNLKEYIEAIKNNQKDMIYALPLAIPAEGGFVNTHVFTEADNHNYLGLCQRLTMMEMQTNVFNSYNGKINKRHIKLYQKTSDGKW